MRELLQVQASGWQPAGGAPVAVDAEGRRSRLCRGRRRRLGHDDRARGPCAWDEQGPRRKFGGPRGVQPLTTTTHTYILYPHIPTLHTPHTAL